MDFEYFLYHCLCSSMCHTIWEGAMLTWLKQEESKFKQKWKESVREIYHSFQIWRPNENLMLK